MTDIPVIGFIIPFAAFLVDQLPIIAPIAVSIAIPIALAALCGVVSERSGVVNIGLEGIILTAAFVGWGTGAAGGALLPPDMQQATAIFGISVPLLVGLVAALLSGMILAALHAWLAISLKADQIISGVIITSAAFGLPGSLNPLTWGGSPHGAGGFKPLNVPEDVANI